MDQADELSLICSLAGMKAREIQLLEQSGWTVTRLATLHGGKKELFDAVVWKLQQLEADVDIDAAMLREIVERANDRARVKHMVDAKRGGQDLLEAHIMHQRAVRQKTFNSYVAEDTRTRVDPVGTAKRGRWPTRLSMKLHIASSDLALRELAERQERERWLKEIRGVVKAANLPVAARSSDEALLIRVAKGRRPNTLRKHVKTWCKAARWMDAAFNCSWPASPEQFAEFLEAMVEEPCSRSFPESVFKTLMFLEHAGEVPEADQICRSAAVKNALEEAAHRLQAIEQKTTKRQALLLPVSIVVAWEAHVVDESVSNYARIYSWFRLVKLWTGTRFDDTKGAPSSTMELLEWGLKGIIDRSKTSGPGKKVIHLPFYVSKEAWIHEKSWLLAGWKLWNAMGMEAGLLSRDFMLPWPNKALTGFIRKMVDYPIASTMSQALFNEIKTGKGSEKQLLLEPGMGVLWTEHSERATIRTWAQAARVPEDVRRMIGRWKPSADEGYERNVRTNVLRCQKVLAHYIKENMANSDPFDETTVVNLVAQRMEAMNYSREEVDEQSLKLLTFMPGEGAAKVCSRPKWSTTGPIVLVNENEDGTEMKQERGQMADAEDEPEEDDAAPAEVTPLEKVAGMYVVSVVGRSKTRTLHKIGDCHRQPGVHYSAYEVLGEDTPSTGQYHRACKQCFGRGDAAAMNALEEETSGDVSSSEMSDSEKEDSTG